MKSPQIKKLTDWHRKQIGTAEYPLGSNNIIYNTLYYGREVSGTAYPWCMAYQYIAFSECGTSGLFCDGTKSASCTYVLNYAKKHGQFVTGDYREGDIFLYDTDKNKLDSEHCGYYTGEMKKGKYVCIEGNYSDRVSEVLRSADDIIGAYRPKYVYISDDIEPEIDLSKPYPNVNYGDVSTSVLALQSLLSMRGYTLKKYGIDGEYGDETQTALDAFRLNNGMEPCDKFVSFLDWYMLLR